MSSIVVARAADIGMQDRRTVRLAPMRGLAIEVVIENGFDRAISPGTELKRSHGSGLDTVGAEGLGQSDDAETRSEPLLGMSPVFQDQVAQERRGRTDTGCLAPDPLDGPAGIATVAGWHVIGLGRVLAIAAGAHMDGDAFTLEEDLNRPRRQAHLDRLARKAIGHGIEMPVDIDVIVDTDPPRSPFGEDIGLDRQRFEEGSI